MLSGLPHHLPQRFYGSHFKLMPAPHRPRKRFGQNFLKDEAIIDQIVGALNLRRSSAVLEIGPGQGALTKKILQRREAGTKLTVVEVDRDLAAELRKESAGDESYEVVEGDVLKIDLHSLRFTQGGCLNICGNLPYNISTPLIFKLLEAQVNRRLAMLKQQIQLASRIAVATRITTLRPVWFLCCKRKLSIAFVRVRAVKPMAVCLLWYRACSKWIFCSRLHPKVSFHRLR